MHPYKYISSSRYSNFTPFTARTFFLYLRFTLHIMSKNSPSIFSKMNLSYDVSAFRYAQGTSEIATYIPSFTSIMRLVNRYSREMVSGDASSLVMKHLWGRSSAHVVPFILPPRFSFIRFMGRIAPFFYDLVMLSGSSALIACMYYNCVYSLYMASTALSPCFLIPFLGVICVNVIFVASLCMLCINSFLFFPVIVHWV